MNRATDIAMAVQFDSRLLNWATDCYTAILVLAIPKNHDTCSVR